MLRRFSVKRMYCPNCNDVHWHASVDKKDWHCVACAGTVAGELGKDTYIFKREPA